MWISNLRTMLQQRSNIGFEGHNQNSVTQTLSLQKIVSVWRHRLWKKREKKFSLELKVTSRSNTSEVFESSFHLINRYRFDRHVACATVQALCVRDCHRYFLMCLILE